MIKPFSIGLKAGERIYINGAVLRVDRKVVLEFLNDVNFLLEQHIMRPEQTTTPLRQLYFVVQTMLMEPANRASIGMMFEHSHTRLLKSFSNERVLAGLRTIHTLIAEDKVFEALKSIRALFPIEDDILSGGSAIFSIANQAGKAA